MKRSTSTPPGWLALPEDLEKARAWVARRTAVLDTVLGWWAQENGRARTGAPGADPLSERLEADFQLLGVQLKRVRFHLGEAEAAYARFAEAGAHVVRSTEPMASWPGPLA